MAQITYTNKETLNEQPSIADKNKVKSEDMNEIKSVVNTNYGEVGNITNLTTPDKTSIVNAINSMQGKILWTNSNPNTAFSAQNVTLSSSDFDFYEIIYKQANDVDRTFNSGLILENTGTILNFNTTSLYFRVVSANSKTSIHFDNGQVGSGASSNAVIPLYIIGYKTGLFS